MRLVYATFFGLWAAAWAAAICGIVVAMIEGGSHVLGFHDYVVLGLCMGWAFVVAAFGSWWMS